MHKYVILGGVLGFITGIVIVFLYPRLLVFEFLYNASTLKQTGIPLYPQYNSGSVLAVGMFFPMLLGIVGGVIVIAISRLKAGK